MEYALTQPAGLASLVLADSLASTAQWISEVNRLRTELPAGVHATLLKHEAAGTTDDPAYQEGMMVFYRRHICRLDPWPGPLNRSFEKFMRNPEVYNTMWGNSEFHMTGTLRNWSVSDRLSEIRLPTLVIGGRFDEATPTVIGTLHRGIAGSEWVIFENRAHMPHIEETDRYLEVLTTFLGRAESHA